MKPALSVPLVSAAVFAAGALVYRLGQVRGRPIRAVAGTTPSGVSPAPYPGTLPDTPKAVASLLDRLRAQGL